MINTSPMDKAMERIFDDDDNEPLLDDPDLLNRMAHLIMEVSDDLQDEGDRVYLGSTNHKDELRKLTQEFFEKRYLSDCAE